MNRENLTTNRACHHRPRLNLLSWYHTILVKWLIPYNLIFRHTEALNISRSISKSIKNHKRFSLKFQTENIARPQFTLWDQNSLGLDRGVVPCNIRPLLWRHMLHDVSDLQLHCLFDNLGPLQNAYGLLIQRRIKSIYGQNILRGISKVSSEISLKKTYPYSEIWNKYSSLRSVNLRAHTFIFVNVFQKLCLLMVWNHSFRC